MHCSLARLGVPLLSVTVLIGACDSAEKVEVKPSVAREKVTSSIPRLTNDTVDAIKTITDGKVLESLGDSLDAVGQAFDSLPVGPSEDDGSGDSGGMKRLLGSLRLGPGDARESDGDQLARFLNENIFIDDNYEGDGTYLVKGEHICGKQVFEGDSGEDSPAPPMPGGGGFDPDGGVLPPPPPPPGRGDGDAGTSDSTCKEDLAKAEIRIHVEETDSAMTVTVLIGPDKFLLVTLEVAESKVALVVDLAEAKKAVTFLADTLGGDKPSLPDVMEGVVALSLTRNGDKDVTIAAAIRSAVRIEGTIDDPDHGGPVKFGSAVKDPLASVHAQGIEKKLTVTLDIGETTLSAPWRAIADGDSMVTGLLGVDLKGLSATIALEEMASSLKVTNIGFGDGTSTIKLDDTTLLSVDLNAMAGRRFDFTLTPVTDALPTFAFAPELDLALAFHLQPLADLGEKIEDFLLDQTFRITFDGTTPTAQPIDGTDSTSAALSIESGTLTISSSAVTDPVVANAGQCISAGEAAEGAHPILGALIVGDCP